MLQRIALFCLIIVPIYSIIVTDPPTPDDYVYSYDIQDPTTGDSKSQHEVRKGDYVKGAYSVIGPDGTKRIVEYTADSKHGFKAVIREEPLVLRVSTPSPGPVQKLYTHSIPASFLPYPLGPQPRTPVKTTVAYKNSHSVFFIPENEIQIERNVFHNGNYFEPVNKRL